MIIGLITTLLPMLLKIILYIIDKKASNDQLKEEFLKFIALIESDIPGVSVKMHAKYNDQIERLRKQINEGK